MVVLLSVLFCCKSYCVDSFEQVLKLSKRLCNGSFGRLIFEIVLVSDRTCPLLSARPFSKHITAGTVQYIYTIASLSVLLS